MMCKLVRALHTQYAKIAIRYNSRIDNNRIVSNYSKTFVLELKQMSSTWIMKVKLLNIILSPKAKNIREHLEIRYKYNLFN